MLGETGVSIDFDASTKVYELDVIDARGRVIESVSGNYTPARPGGILPDTPTAETLKELHGMARRSALDVDSTLDKLVSRLDAIA